MLAIRELASVTPIAVTESSPASCCIMFASSKQTSTSASRIGGFKYSGAHPRWNALAANRPNAKPRPAASSDASNSELMIAVELWA